MYFFRMEIFQEAETQPKIKQAAKSHEINADKEQIRVKPSHTERPPRSHLVMHQDVHDVVVNFRGDPSLRLVGKQDILNSQQRHQDERRSHCFHVETGLGLMSHFQFGDENSNNVQEEKQVDLEGGIKKTIKNQYNNMALSCCQLRRVSLDESKFTILIL